MNGWVDMLHGPTAPPTVRVRTVTPPRCLIAYNLVLVDFTVSIGVIRISIIKFATRYAFCTELGPHYFNVLIVL